MTATEPPLPPVDGAPLPPIDGAPAELARIRPEGYLGGASLLAADARVASMLADEARRRAMYRVFGIPLDSKSGLATLIALGALSNAVGRKSRVIAAQRPGSFDGLVGLGVLRNSAYGLAGPASRESQYFATLLGLALLGGGARIVARKSVRSAKALSHTAWGEFHHRYGHLIRPNQRRPNAAGGNAEPLSDVPPEMGRAVD